MRINVFFFGLTFQNLDADYIQINTIIKKIVPRVLRPFHGVWIVTLYRPAFIQGPVKGAINAN
jgi:hypothetical protein